MKHLLLTLSLLLSFAAKAQFTLGDQIRDFANAVPSYYHGHVEVLLDNMSDPIVLSSQSRNWNRNWKIKYGLSISTQVFGLNTNDVSKINRGDLYHSDAIQFMGPANNALGEREGGILRQYLLTEDGDRVVNPLTGEYVYFETELPGGLGGVLGVVPYMMPQMEVRLWKGLSISGGLIPLDYFMRDMETGNFETKINMYNYGVCLNMRNFLRIPGLSWLQFEASQTHTNLGLSNLQDAIDFDESALLQIGFNNLSLQNNTRTFQYRGTLGLPLSRRIVLAIQGGFYGHRYDFRFDYDISANINAEKLKEEYDLDFESEQIDVKGAYKQGKNNPADFYYSGGVLFEGMIASVYLGYANINHPTVTFKTTLRLL